MYRLTKKQKLLVRADFEPVFKTATRFKSRYFTLFIRLSTDVDRPARLGIAVPKKNVPRAVDRNRIKRVIREVFRHQGAQISGDVVVVAHQGCGALPSQVLRGCLEKEWAKIVKIVEQAF